MKILAIFKGQDGSMDFKHGEPYYLNIFENEDGEIAIQEIKNKEHQCSYESIEAFLRNWDNNIKRS